MKQKDKGSFLLGIAMKAGKVKSGELACINSIRDGTACLILLADDASANTVKKFKDKTEYYGTAIIQRYTKEELGRSIGKEERAVLAITDKGLADAFLARLTDTEDDNGIMR